MFGWLKNRKPWPDDDRRRKRGAFWIAGIVISLGIVGSVLVFVLMK